jgi:glutamate racemase
MDQKRTKTLSPSQPIGIFDSGVGGLSIVKCITELLPDEELIYVADSKYAPYGRLSTDDIVKRVNHIADRLIAMNVKAIVIACNTATVNAIDQLRKRVALPIIGVEPAIKPAAKSSKTKAVGLLVTQATASNDRFISLVNKYSNGAQVHIQPCPDLANLIEQGHINSTQSYDLLNKYLTPLIDKNIDSLVLGCTHYPFVSEQIEAILGKDIELVETALPVTKELIRQLNMNTHYSADSKSTHQHLNIKIFSSMPTTSLEQTIAKLWPELVQQSESLSITNIN